MSKWKDMLVADLRTVPTAEAAQAIEKIEDVHTLILPLEGEPELLEALAAIPREDVYTTVALPVSTRVVTLNGRQMLGRAELMQDAFYLANGKAIVTEPCPEPRALLAVNGKLIYPKSCPVQLVNVSGSLRPIDYEHYLRRKDDFLLDSLTLELMEDKTLLEVDGDLCLTEDISLEQLLAKKPWFLVDGDIQAPLALAPYLRLRAETKGELDLREEA